MTKFPKLLAVLCFCSVGLTPTYLQGQVCGGTERWAVKVGTDAGVINVDLSEQTPMGVPDMLGLHEPHRPPSGDNDTRLPEETHVYVVTGHLVKFKIEAGSTGDQDYHMVITDDTLSFTDNHAHQPPGHSLVAEIPNPDCIPGQHGSPTVQSRFIDSIRGARRELEAQFPNIDSSGAFNDAGGIPVRITGIGFFDFPHGQVGRASNNVELHPVLDITFNPSTSVPVPQPTGPSVAISITGPSNGSVVSGLVNVNANATNGSGVVKTEIYIDGTIRAWNIGASSIGYPWDTTAMTDGTHTILSKCYDSLGNVGTSSIVTVTVKN